MTVTKSIIKLCHQSMNQ